MLSRCASPQDTPTTKLARVRRGVVRNTLRRGIQARTGGVPPTMRTVYACLLLLTCSAPAWAQDTDADGVVDGADAFPCDARASASAYAPARGSHGLLLFEDEWPHQTDYDFNDLVVAYNMAFRQDAAGRTVGLRLSIDVLALGGVFDNGLALHLPVPANMVSEASRSLAGGPAQVLTPRPQDAQAVLDLSPNLRELFGDQAGSINSRTDRAHQQGALLRVDIAFHTPVSLPAGAAPYDLFVYRAGRPRHEIHTPGYCGTAIMDQTLFGTGIDASSTRRCFVDARGLPFGISLPQPAPYAKEATDLALLYPSIVDFAQSEGTIAADFYLSPNRAHSYPTAHAPRFATSADLPVDLSCGPAQPPASQTAEISAIVGSVRPACSLSYPPSQCDAAAASAIEDAVLMQLGRTQHSPLSCELWTINVRNSACTLSSTTSVRAVFSINEQVVGTKCTGPGCGVDVEIYVPVGQPVLEHPLDTLSLPIQPDLFYIDGPNPLPGLSLDARTGDISFTATREDVGTHRLKIAVLDILEQVVEINLLLHVVILPAQPDGPATQFLVQGAATQSQAVVVPSGPLAAKRLVFAASSDEAFVVEVQPLLPASLHAPAGSTIVGAPYELTVRTGTVGLDVAYYDDSVDGLTSQDLYQNIVQAPATRRARPAFAQSATAQLDANQGLGFTRNVSASQILQHVGGALTNTNRSAGITQAHANLGSVSFRVRPVGFRGVYYTHSFTGTGGASILNRTHVSLPSSQLAGIVMITKAQLDADPGLSSIPELSVLTAAERQDVLRHFHYFDAAIDYLVGLEAQTAARAPTCFTMGPAELRNGGIKVTVSDALDPTQVAVYQLPLALSQAAATLRADLLNPVARAKVILSQSYGRGLNLDGATLMNQETRHVLRHEYGHALQGMALERSPVATFYLTPGSHDHWLLESTAEAFAMTSALPGDLSAPGPQATLQTNSLPLGTYTNHGTRNPYKYAGFFNLLPMPLQGGGQRGYGFDTTAMCRLFEEKVPRSEHFSNYLAQYAGVSDLAAWYADYRASLSFSDARAFRGGPTVNHRVDTISIRPEPWADIDKAQMAALEPIVIAPANRAPTRIGVSLLHDPSGHRPVRLRGEAYDLGTITAQNRLLISDRRQPVERLRARVATDAGPLALDTISQAPAAGVSEMRADAVYDIAANGSLGLVIVNDLYSQPQTLEREYQDRVPKFIEALLGPLVDVKDHMAVQAYPVVQLTADLVDGPGNAFAGQVRIIDSNRSTDTHTKRFLGQDLSTAIDANGHFSLDDVPFNNFSSNERRLTLEVSCPSGGYGAGGVERVTVDWADQGNGPMLQVNLRMPSLRCSYGGTPLATDVGWTASWRWGIEGFISNFNACRDAIATFEECLQTLHSAPGRFGEVLVSTTFVGMSTPSSHDYQQVWRQPDGSEHVNAASCYSRTYCLPRTP